MEEWKDIKGYEGYYKISNRGRLLSWRIDRPRFKHKVLKQITTSKGYGVYALSRKGKVIIRQSHRLVAEAFISNPENKPQVNHKDAHKLNNNAENLEWATSKENIRHSIDYGRRRGRALTEEQVVYIRNSTETNNSLATRFSCCRNTLSSARRGLTYKYVNA